MTMHPTGTILRAPDGVEFAVEEAVNVVEASDGTPYYWGATEDGQEVNYDARGLIVVKTVEELEAERLAAGVDTAQIGAYLRRRATHGNHGEGWVYTRDTGDLKHIRYRSDSTGYDALHRRLGRAVVALGAFRASPLEKKLGLKPTLMSPLYRIYFKVRNALIPDSHLPDGKLPGVYTFWEETGEYIEMVGPTIGEKIADFLEQEPDHPHAKAIATEMNRIHELARKARTE